MTDIGGLEQCVSLESLWITECRLRRIDGLQGCVNLKNLHLSSNALCSVEGLTTLTNLELLWLNDNSIKRAEGLDALTSLRVLWLCRNQISEIGPGRSRRSRTHPPTRRRSHTRRLACVVSLASLAFNRTSIALTQNQRLEELNLAHNRISSFRDILNLARLSSLKRHAG